MAISVDWSSGPPYLITIPQSDLTLVSGTRYQITVNTLWQLLREFSETQEGIARIVTYRRTAATASTPAITEINDPTYSCEFEDGLYSVDIIDGNTNFRDVEVKNQVSVGTNNTTGFINPTFLELGLFNGQVCVDVVNGVSGTDKTPAGGIIGTRSDPVDNMADALTIATTRGLNVFNMLQPITITSGDYSAGYQFQADRLQTTITVNAAANVSNCTFTNCTVVGELDGINRVFNAEVGAVTSVSGEMFQCGLQSSIAINGKLSMFQCFSDIEGTGYPLITNIGTNVVVCRDMRGSLGLAGMTGGDHSIGVYGGRIIAEATCSGGNIYARGDPYDIVNSGTATIIDQTTPTATTAKVWAYTGP